MSDEQIRNAVATICGTLPTLGQAIAGGWDGEDCDPPDYPHDLNAIAEAVATLDEIEAVKFVKEIDRMAFNNAFHAITATARQRCIAFLKCKGLWRD